MAVTTQKAPVIPASVKMFFTWGSKIRDDRIITPLPPPQKRNKRRNVCGFNQKEENLSIWCKFSWLAAAITHPVEYRQKRLTQNVALHFVGQVRCARVCTRVCLSDC